MTSWLRRGQSALSTFSPPSAPLKVYTRPEVNSGYNSPPEPHSDTYSTPPVSATGYDSPSAGYDASSQSGYSAPPAPAQSGYSSPAQPAQSGYSSPPAAHSHASQQSGYSSNPSTPIPIIPVPTYLPIQYDVVQIPPGYQVGRKLWLCTIITSSSCLSDSSSIHRCDCWYGSYFGNLVVSEPYRQGN